MDAVNYSQARAKLASLLDRVCDDHYPMLITRQGKPSAVLLSLEDYESLDETAYLKSSPANARRLSESIRDLEAGRNVVQRRSEDLVP